MKGEGLRVSLFMPNLAGGGAERAMLNLADGLSQRYATELVLVKAEGAYLEEAIKKGIPLVDLKSSKPRYSLLAFARYVKEKRPHVVISALEAPSVFAALVKKLMGGAYKLIITEHSTPSRHYPQQKRLLLRTFPFWARFSYDWADRLVAVSTGVARDAIRTYQLNPKKVATIYNPVITPSFWAQKDSPATHPFYGTGEPVLLAAGRLSPEKDFSSLLKAFREVLSQRKARLIIFGEGPERTNLEELASSLGIEKYVSFPGFIKNLPAHMARASLFILSSRWEGLPTVLIEALAVGTPVVSTDCPSGPREILEDGKWGKLVPVGDIEALAQAILEQLENPIFPSEKAWRRFTLEEISKKWFSLIEELA